MENNKIKIIEIDPIDHFRISLSEEILVRQFKENEIDPIYYSSIKDKVIQIVFDGFYYPYGYTTVHLSDANAIAILKEAIEVF